MGTRSYVHMQHASNDHGRNNRVKNCFGRHNNCVRNNAHLSFGVGRTIQTLQCVFFSAHFSIQVSQLAVLDDPAMLAFNFPTWKECMDLLPDGRKE